MLLALVAKDRVRFDKLLSWTEANLQVAISLSYPCPGVELGAKLLMATGRFLTLILHLTQI